MLPSTWQAQADFVRRAVADGAPIPFEELLLVRDLAGKFARQLDPEPNVTPREAAALLLLFPQQGELVLPLTVRASHLPTHAGQVSLPGGATDPEDADVVATALREAHEELGIEPATVEVWGKLTPFYIPPSNFRLSPVIGFMPMPPALRPNPAEVADTIIVPLHALLDPATVRVEQWERLGTAMIVPYFALGGHKVWGATALLLSELVARLRRAH